MILLPKLLRPAIVVIVKMGSHSWRADIWVDYAWCWYSSLHTAFTVAFSRMIHLLWQICGPLPWQEHYKNLALIPVLSSIRITHKSTLPYHISSLLTTFNLTYSPAPPPQSPLPLPPSSPTNSPSSPKPTRQYRPTKGRQTTTRCYACHTPCRYLRNDDYEYELGYGADTPFRRWGFWFSSACGWSAVWWERS